MAGSTNRFKIIEQFLANGMNRMFGNPGTVEQGFLDALADYPEMKYILTLQESVAVLTADGYARSMKKNTLVQIHSTPGLGNSIGALYQAMRGHSPLVVIGGDAGIRYINMDAQMAGDLVSIAKPVTKWASMILEPQSCLRMIRRAIKIAGTPPMGPVYLCLPMDVLDAECTEEIYPVGIPSTRVRPDSIAIDNAADILLSAEKPMIFVGDGVAYSGAVEELTQVADLLGAEVYGVDSGDVNMDWSHPLWQGATGHMFGYHSLPITQKGDVNLLVGTYMVPEVFPELGSIFASKARNIHIDLNAYEIGKNHRADISFVADPKLTLKALSEALNAKRTKAYITTIESRVSELSNAKEQSIAEDKEADDRIADNVPMDFSVFAKELAKNLPADTIIFDEALTSSPALTRYIVPKKEGSFFQTRGGSLGVGIPGAIGLKVANPDNTVIGFTGDGGSMYTIQALWTAARHNIDAKFVICNNGSYRLLQLNIDAYWRERNFGIHAHPLPFDLSEPPVDFAGLAEAMGVKALKVEKPEEVGTAIRKMLDHKGPFLIDVILEGDKHSGDVALHCGQ